MAQWRKLARLNWENRAGRTRQGVGDYILGARDVDNIAGKFDNIAGKFGNIG